MSNLAYQLDPEPVFFELFDEDGFILEPTHWNRDLATHIADFDGVGLLTDKHWQIIEHLRAHVLKFGGVPAMRRICRANGVSRDEMHDLFGGCRQIWRLAGLANPGEEAKAYF